MKRQVIIWDDLKQKPAITLEFRSDVHKVRLSRNRIVVVLQNSVHVYVFSSPPEKLSVYETVDNPSGLCCLSTKWLAFPGRTHGQVHLVDIESGVVRIIPAHTSALRAIDISPDGAIMATASEVVRIMSYVNVELLLTKVGYIDSSICYREWCQNRRTETRCRPCFYPVGFDLPIKSDARSYLRQINLAYL